MSYGLDGKYPPHPLIHDYSATLQMALDVGAPLLVWKFSIDIDFHFSCGSPNPFIQVRPFLLCG